MRYHSGIQIGGKHVFIDGWYLNGVAILETFLMKMELNFQDKILLEGSTFLSPPMQYIGIKCNSKYMSLLSVDRSSLKRDYSPFMPFYFETDFDYEKTKIIYIFNI